MRTDGAGGTHEFVTGSPDNDSSTPSGQPDRTPRSANSSSSRSRPGPRRTTPTCTARRRLGHRTHRPARPDGLAGGMRVIVRAERPHPGAQLRFTDVNGNRLTAFATNTRGGQLPDLELRHRRRARCEDRIRNAKDTGLRNLPLHDFRRTRSGSPSSCWPPNSPPGCRCCPGGHPARVWEPKRLRLRLFSIAGRITRRSRRTRLQLSAHAPWATAHRLDPATTRIAHRPHVTTNQTGTPGKWSPAEPADRATRRTHQPGNPPKTPNLNPIKPSRQPRERSRKSCIDSLDLTHSTALPPVNSCLTEHYTLWWSDRAVSRAGNIVGGGSARPATLGAARAGRTANTATGWPRTA